MANNPEKKLNAKESQDCDLKECMGKLLIQEIRDVVRYATKQVLVENEEIEELHCKIKNYEDHIACLEQMVEQLQLMLRSQLDREGMTDGGSTSSGELNTAKKVEVPPPTILGFKWMRQSSALNDQTILSQQHKLRMEYKLSKENKKSSASNGSLDDFL